MSDTAEVTRRDGSAAEGGTQTASTGATDTQGSAQARTGATYPVAVVAGGTAGVGRAVVDELVAHGYRVAVMARGQDRLDQLVETLGADRVSGWQCDVADAEAMMELAARIRDDVGRPTVWINAAMLTSFSPFDKVTPEEFDRITAGTYLGQVNGTRAALSVMETGRIVNVGSGLGYRPVPYQAAYVGAKHAINGFTGSLRSELIRQNRPITLSLVQLPAINTPQFDWARNRLEEMPQPAPPIFQPEVAARAVMRAVETGKREYMVGSSVLKLVFGDMILPNWLDRKMSKAGADMQKSGRDEPGDRPDNLFEPVQDYPSAAHGSFDERAEASGLIVDADLFRKLLFFGVPALTFVLGLLLG